MNDDQNQPAQVNTLNPPLAGRRRKSFRYVMTGAAFVAVLALGAVGGAAANRFVHRNSPDAVMLLQPAPIAQLKDATAIAIKGQVMEVFGNKFIVQDDSGRTLIDVGPRGEGGKPVSQGETVTVQGRFEGGFVHAQVMARADGTTESYGPPQGPRQGPRGPGKRGPGPDRGPGVDRLPDRGPEADAPPSPR